MALPNVFANATALYTPELDENYDALGALTVIPCTASGTNTVVLTTAADTPTISAYTDSAPVFSFVAAATSTGAVTININGVGAKNLYKNNGQTAAGAADLQLDSLYQIAYNAALNGAAGGFVILNQGASSSSAGSVQGTFQNLIVTNTTAGTPDEECVVTADSVAVSDGSTAFTTLFGVNVTIDNTASGANGLDTGALATSTWYAIYVIYNVNTLTTAGLMSASFTSPTLPSGYTQFALVGAMRTDGSSDFLRILQYGRAAQYVVTGSTNTDLLPVIANGVAGTFSATSPVLASASVTTACPTAIASRISILASNQYHAGAASNLIVAPNTDWGGTNRGPAGSAGQPYPIYVNGVIGGYAQSAWLELESTAVAWACSGVGGAITCLGYELNL